MYDLYDMIFKRKSFRRFNNSLSLTKDELERVNERLKMLVQLYDSIKIKYKIVRREDTTCKRGEYCLLIYSEQTEKSLLNIGYTIEQLDLWMASQNIGVCWYGAGKTDQLRYEGLEYIIMVAFGKGEPEEFRKDYTKAKRKGLEEILKGESLPNITDVVRFAPSACNSQPWRLVVSNKQIRVFRSKEVRSIFPKEKLLLYNSIDIGIFLYFMELALAHENYKYERIICLKEHSDEKETEVAKYIFYKES